MTVNFSPSLEPYKETGSFRFWCQKVLPLVYDDSLSYYELLCKVVNHLNGVIPNIDGLKVDVNKLLQAYNQLQEYVNNYFDNLDTQEEINNKLDEMVKDGIFDDIIYDKLINIPFIPDSRHMKPYRENAYETIASYFASGVGLNSVVGESNIQNKVAWVYTDSNKGYMGVLGEGSDGFVYTDKKTIDGVQYPVGYIDCTQFVSLITKARNYEISAYEYAFNNSVIDEETLRHRCLEAGGIDDKPYTFDFMNYIYSARIAYIMDSSGQYLKLVSSKTSPDFMKLEPYFNNLEDGDILFAGNPTMFPDRYLNLHHCMMYFKTLDGINKACEKYGISVKDIDDGYESQYGYIVHCTGSSETHVDTLRINTFASYCNSLPSNGQRIIYSCKPYSNSLNSNKARRSIDFLLTEYNKFGFGNRHGTYNSIEITPDGTMKVGQMKINGEVLADNTDLNELKDGWYRAKKTISTGGYKNAPNNLLGGYFDIISWGKDTGSKNGGQILISSYGEICARIKKVDSSEWQSWSVVSGINRLQTNEYNFGVVNAHSKSTRHIEFATPYETEPNVVACLRVDNSWGVDTLANLSVSVFNESNTGFDLTAVNNSENNLIIGAHWTAK